MTVVAMAIVGLSSAGVLGLASLAGAARGLGVSAAPTHPSVAALEKQITALLHHSVAKKSKIKTEYSYNWAGYAFVAKDAYNGTLTEVSAAWFTPVVTCNEPSGTPSFQVSWVGFDGASDGTVEQGGTLSYCSNNGATPAYYTWWEFYPYNSVQLVYQISGADAIQAYVLYNPGWCFGDVCGVYTIAVSDVDNQGADFSITGNPTVCDAAGCEGGQDADAEVISEAPGGYSANGGYYYLADYGTSQFYEAQVTVNGHSTGIGAESSKLGKTYLIDEVGFTSGAIIQTTSALSPDLYGQYFALTWSGFD